MKSCFGETCAQRKSCQRYAAIELPGAESDRIDYCGTVGGARPLYIPIRSAVPELALECESEGGEI